MFPFPAVAGKKITASFEGMDAAARRLATERRRSVVARLSKRAFPPNIARYNNAKMTAAARIMELQEQGWSLAKR